MKEKPAISIKEAIRQLKYADLKIPDGLTSDDLKVAENMVIGWKEFDNDYSGIDVVIKVYEYLESAASARLRERLRERHEVAGLRIDAERLGNIVSDYIRMADPRIDA